MRRRNKVIFGVLGAAVLIVALPFLAILPWAASNVVGAAYYLVFTTAPSPQELTGIYIAKPQWGIATLTLAGDGTFKEVVSETGKDRRAMSGKYSVASADGGHAKAITLYPYINVQNENYGQTYNYSTVNFYKRRLGSTFGVLDDDTGLQYTKTHD
jgi:hypothetical protein